MRDRYVFSIFLFLRILSVLIVSTWFVPDEFYQSLEIAHKLVYGYGYVTWEWSKGIRSYIPPAVIALLYKIFNIFQFDTPLVLIYAPRILQALLSSFADYQFWKWCGKSKWSIFCISSSWFWFYTASRTLSNTLETCLTTIALSLFPFTYKSKHEKSENGDFLWIVGLACIIRPTAALIWLPLCIYHLSTSRNTVFRSLIVFYLPVAIVTVTIVTTVDSLMHGNFVLTWYEFLKLNVFEGIGVFYGSHPWHWYLSQGLPAILGIYLIPFLLAAARIIKYRKDFVDDLTLLATITFTVAVYSFLGHKEFRFILPVLPIALHITAKFLTNWSRKSSDLLVWIVACVLLFGNLVPAIYLGHFHQRGNLDVMPPLREICDKNPERTSLLFLMPCHSTPLYSHLHQNVTARFLTCNPNLSKVENYVDEADHFYSSPGTWLRNNYPPNKPLPSHIIAFDTLVPLLSDILSRYKPILRIYNTNIPVHDQRIGRFVTVHELI